MSSVVGVAVSFGMSGIASSSVVLYLSGDIVACVTIYVLAGTSAPTIASSSGHTVKASLGVGK